MDQCNRCQYILNYEDGSWDSIVIPVPFEDHASMDELVAYGEKVVTSPSVVCVGVWNYPYIDGKMEHDVW